MSEVKWIKICTDIFDDEKILLIEGMPDKYAIITAWFKLLCLAGKQNNSGVFLLNDTMPYTDEMFATIFRMPINTVRLALSTFEQFGMIEIVNGVVTIPKWDKHQSLERLDKIREYQKVYHRDYRKKQALIAETAESKADSKLYVKRLEEEVDKKKNKSNNSIKEDLFVSFANGDDVLLDALRNFEDMRKSIKAPLTDRAKALLINKLKTFPHHQWAEILNQSVLNSWKSIYPLDKKNDFYKMSNGKETSNPFLAMLDKEVNGEQNRNSEDFICVEDSIP